MKQRMYTIQIQRHPTREQRKRRRVLAWADRLYTVAMALLCTAALALAVVGLGWVVWE
jgi:hypothetical protein